MIWSCSICSTRSADPTRRPSLDPRIASAWCSSCEKWTIHRAVADRAAAPEARSEPAAVPAGAFERGIAASDTAGQYRWTFLERLQVDRAIVAVASRLAEFTTDDVWQELGADFPVTKGMAGRLMAAKNAGIIDASGRVTVSQRDGEHGHAQRLGIWLSRKVAS